MPDQSKNEFISLLEDGISGSQKHGRRRNVALTMAYFIAIIASGASTILALLESFPKELIAVFAATPAVMILFVKTLVLDSQATWYWKRAQLYSELSNSVRFAGLPIDQASKQLAEINKGLGTRPTPGLFSMKHTSLHP